MLSGGTLWEGILTRALLLVLLTACGFGGSEPKRAGKGPADAERPERHKELSDKLVTQFTRDGKPGTVLIKDLPADQPPLVALIVLDTLRADRTSFCGYTNPTTPVMVAAREAGALWSCDAYTPATWTLPSHASYFTGASTAEHGVHTLGTRLEDRFETLAETWHDRGYQTLFISGNPVFTNEATGFWQGFDRVVAAKALTGPLRGQAFEGVVADEIAKLDKTRPVFLVVNIFDAHDPYPAVPEGVPWAKAQPRTNLLPHTAEPTNPYYSYVTGGMKAEDQPGFLEMLRNGYQWGVHSADTNLGLLINVLRQTGWFKQQHRIVVTSDHGEHLGEHQLLRHGSATWQTVTKVPFLYLDNTPSKPAALPSPMSTTTAFYLLRDGKLPDPAVPVESASATNVEDFKPSWFTVAMWGSTTDKIMHFDGKEWQFDLAKDPMEEHPGPLPADHALVPRLRTVLEEQRVSIEAALHRVPDAAVMEMLKSVGYVQDNKLEAEPGDKADKPPTDKAPEPPSDKK